MGHGDFVSVDHRRRRWRPRPITLVVAGVVLLLVVGGLVWGISTVARATGVRPLTTGPAAGGATATPATGVEAEPYPVTWTVRLGRDEGGRLIGVVDDPAVVEAVRRNFLEAWEWAFASTTPHNPADLERYFAPVPEGVDDPVFRPDPVWWYGLEEAREDLKREGPPGILRRVVLEGGEWEVRVERFSTDGTVVFVRGRYVGGRCRIEFVRTDTGELAGESDGRCMLYLAGMVYDPDDGRWKVAGMLMKSPD